MEGVHVMPTKIDWCDEVWNPVTGCSKISPGCDHCYAERMARRLAGRCGYDAKDPFQMTVHQDRLRLPLKWRTPRVVFVNSMGDLFHPAVPTRVIDSMLEVIAARPQHTFMALTKRPENIEQMLYGVTAEHGMRELGGGDYLPNLWLGITAENSYAYQVRIRHLMQAPGKGNKFISIEPMLGPLDMGGEAYSGPYKYTLPDALGCVILGGETGPGARPMHPAWVRSVRDQCAQAGVPFFFKGWGEWAPRENYGRFYPKAKQYIFDDGTLMLRVGKKKSGRLLDGRTHDDLPWRKHGGIKF